MKNCLSNSLFEKKTKTSLTKYEILDFQLFKINKLLTSFYAEKFFLSISLKILFICILYLNLADFWTQHCQEASWKPEGPNWTTQIRRDHRQLVGLRVDGGVAVVASHGT